MRLIPKRTLTLFSIFLIVIFPIFEPVIGWAVTISSSISESEDSTEENDTIENDTIENDEQKETEKSDLISEETAVTGMSDSEKDTDQISTEEKNSIDVNIQESLLTGTWGSVEWDWIEDSRTLVLRGGEGEQLVPLLGK